MKIKNLLTVAALALPFGMSATVALSTPFTVTNADGTVIELKAFGNEHFNYITDINEEFVMERDSQGNWVKAVRDGRVITTASDDLDILCAEQSGWAVKAAADRNRMAPLEPNGRTTFPTIGDNVHALVVLLEFNDVRFTVPDIHTAIDKMLNSEGYSDYNAVGSARDYYKDASDGKFVPTFDVWGPVTLSGDCSFYGGGEGDYMFGKAIEEGLTKLHEQGLDFSKYDYDNDGRVDNIFFFYAGYGAADKHEVDIIWPHQGDYQNYRYRYDDYVPLNFDGKAIRTYACGNELPAYIPTGESYPYLVGIGTFCHEFGHVLGLPDLYDTDGGRTKTPGKYDLMDQGSYNGGYRDAMSIQPPTFSAYEKWVCKWVDFETLEDGTTVTLPTNSTDGDSKVAGFRVKRTPTKYHSEYYFFETRTADKWDSTLPQTGMFIWHVDFNMGAWTSNSVNVGNSPRIELIGYDEKSDIMTWGNTEGEINYVYPDGFNGIVPNNRPTVQKIFLSGIAYDAAKKESTFTFNKVTEQSTATVADLAATRPAEGRQVFLNWKPVDGAEGYLVTVSRTTASGATRYVDNYNEKNVGNVTACTVNNITTDAWSQDFKVEVRAIVPVPAAVAAEITFVPQELQIGAGVTAVDAESIGVRGLQGRIEAPEGAEAYNMSGSRTGLENLPAGVYIVRVEGKTTKVVVK